MIDERGAEIRPDAKGELGVGEGQTRKQIRKCDPSSRRESSLPLECTHGSVTLPGIMLIVYIAPGHRRIPVLEFFFV